MGGSPQGYYDRYGNPAYPKSLGWQKVLANPSRGIQCSEFNELQSIINNRIKDTADGIFAEASFIKGGVITTTQVGDNSTVTATLSGTPTVGDVIQLTFTGTSVASSPQSVSYTTITGDTLATIALALSNLINASANLNSSVIKAVAVGAVITVSYPSVALVTLTRLVTGTTIVTVAIPPIYVLVTGGTFYNNGYYFQIPAAVPTPAVGQLQSAIITGVGTEILGLQINTVVSTEIDDPTLLDQVSLSSNSGNPGAHRETFTYSYAINSATAVTVATFKDGQLVSNPNTSGIWADILALLALRTRETSGSYITKRPLIQLLDIAAPSSNPAQIKMTLSDGTGYPAGVRVDNTGKKVQLSLQRPLTTLTRSIEGHIYSTGTNVYTLSNPPYWSITTIAETVTSSSFNMIRGGVVNGMDAIPSQYQPAVALVTVSQAGVPYVQNVDYQLSGNNIQWLNGGTAPAGGSTYQVIDQFTQAPVKGIRTFTQVTGEINTISNSETVTFAGNLKRTLTVGGTFHTGDVLNWVVTSAGVAGSPLTISYTTLVGDTNLTGVATGLKNAINASAALTAAGFSATSSGPVVTVSYPTTLVVTFATSVTGGGATETLTGAASYIGDTVALQFTSTAIAGSPVTKTYTLVDNDNATTIAAGLTSLITGTAAITGAGIGATSSAGVIKITWPTTISGALSFSRTVTPVGASAETMTLAAGPSTFTLTHPELSPGSTLFTNNVSHVVYKEDVDFTVTSQTGLITWIGTPPVNAINCGYYYWVHTLEGDFLSRDSFVDAAGNPLRYASPKFAGLTGPAIDYTKQIYWTSAGTKPVNGSTFYVTYEYLIGRIDVLVWNTDGTFQILPGTPSLTPVAPSISDTQLPICKVVLPPEAFAGSVSLENYNNQTLLVTDLRTMQNQINQANYNLAQFQLAQDALATQTTGQTKLGIFADPFVNANYTDIGSPFFNGTFDFLAQTFSLPRTMYTLTGLAMTGSGATLKQDIWLTNYTEVTTISQPYASRTDQVNEWGFVNLDAHVTLNPSAITTVDDSVLDVVSQGQGYTSYTTQTLHYPTYDGGTPNISYHYNPWTGATYQQIDSYNPVHYYTNDVTTLVSVYNPGTPLTPDKMVHSQVWQNLNPSTPLSGAAGLSSSSSPSSLLDQIPVDQDWVSLLTPAASTTTAAVGVLSQNKWATVISSAQIVTNQYADQKTVTVTGTNFISGLGSIVCLFNNVAVPLTGINGTTQDLSHTGAVIADANGKFQATFVIPPKTPLGQSVIQIIQSQPQNPGLTASMGSATMTLGAYTRDIKIYETFSQPYSNYASDQQAVYYLCNILGFMPNSAVLASTSASAAITIAEAVIQAKAEGITLNVPLLVAGMTAMFGATSITPVPSSTLLTTVANAITFTSLDPNAIAAQILAVAPGFKHSLTSNKNVVTDPLAQTFTLPQNAFVTSVDLFFATAPAAKEVSVILTTTENGFPTKDYVAQKWLGHASINVGGTATKFTFDKPIYLKANVEYAFIVKTDDVLVTIYTARLGEIDPNNGLITKNPSSGTMLSSPNASTWQLVAGADIKFNINTALFSSTTSTINLGQLTFPAACSRFSFYTPTSIPDAAVHITWQYSTDNVTWNTFAPARENDLGNAFSSIWVRMVLTGTSQICPVVQNAPSAYSFIWLAAGKYVHRQIQLPTASSRYIDVYVDIDTTGGGSTVTIEVSFDNGVSWNSVSEVVADQINHNNVWYEHHFHYDTGGPLKQNIITRASMASGVNYITPRITNYRAICT